MTTGYEYDLSRRVAAETLGTAVLVTTVIGSGIMASRLSGDVGLQLLGNTIPTGAILVVMITLIGPISGAHFNPVVSLVMWRLKAHTLAETSSYCVAQVAGGLIGAMLANLMFQLPAVEFSLKERTGSAQWLAEIVATFGLLFVVLSARHLSLKSVPALVGLYITAAYWFTASTSFANPAVTIARTITNTFAGIAPASAPAFIVAQFIGAAAAMVFCGWLLQSNNQLKGEHGARGHLP